MLRLWKLFLLTWWLFHCVWKNAQDSWRVFQSLISLSTPPVANPPSQYCFTKEVSANAYNKNLLTLLHPMILLLFSCCDKGSSCRWPFELGREEAEKASEEKEWIRFCLVEKAKYPKHLSWTETKQEAADPGLLRACLETGIFLKPTFCLPYFISKLWVLTTTDTSPFPFYFF